MNNDKPLLTNDQICFLAQWMWMILGLKFLFIFVPPTIFLSLYLAWGCTGMLAVFCPLVFLLLGIEKKQLDFYEGI